MKIVGIGLGRTGTSSLHEAFRLLGYKTIHGSPRLHPNEISDMNHSIYRFYDCLCDTPYYYLYDKIDKHYQCKFIYTHRDLDAWLESMSLLFSNYQHNWGEHSHKHHTIFYGTKDFEVNAFTDAYYRHDDNVNKYFKDRENDLLRINITANDSDTNWKLLCDFLHKDIPNQPFPHKFKLRNT